ncbi:hypothetical protein AAEX37_02155 [Oligella sp. MSHR50489EDL]|uniref:hypothetical protein n=1 Tax=Oligella sp. MSHR50489EDL TaxID=3139409 RepID=UPI003D8183BE
MDYSYEYSDKLDYKHSRLSSWLEVMLNSKNKVLKPMSDRITKDPIFEEVLSLMDMSTKSAEEVEEMRLSRKYDIGTLMEFHDVYEEAKEEGIAIGEARGEAKGEAKVQLEIAQNLKLRGYSLTEIKEITGISSQLLERLH